MWQIFMYICNLLKFQVDYFHVFITLFIFMKFRRTFQLCSFSYPWVDVAGVDGWVKPASNAVYTARRMLRGFMISTVTTLRRLMKFCSMRVAWNVVHHSVQCIAGGQLWYEAELIFLIILVIFINSYHFDSPIWFMQLNISHWNEWLISYVYDESCLFNR